MKLQESTISMIFGVLVVLVIGYLAVNYIQKQDGLVQNPLKIGNEQVNETKALEHTVGDNETLWSISEQYYGSGFNWTKIRDANNITDPNQIEKGQTLRIPDSEDNTEKLASGVSDESPATSTPEPTKVATTSLPENKPSEQENTQAKQDGEVKHTVERGDNLWLLAEQYYNDGFRWKQIAEENNIDNPSDLEIGKEITINNSTIRVASASTNTQSDDEELSKSTSYTVQKGDSLWSISIGAYGDGNKWVDIAKENDLDTPSVIHAGNTLKLPRTS